MQAGDIRAARDNARMAQETGNCTTIERDQAWRFVSLLRFNQILDAINEGQSLESFEPELRSLSKRGATWHIYDALADIARKKKNYSRAANLYMAALADASNQVLTPDWMAPDEAYIRTLDKNATEMRLVAQKPVRFTRSQCKVSYRSVKIRKKTTPIRFVFGKTTFTPRGRKAAEDLFKCLQSNGAKSVTLIGHTDPVGSAAYNLRLSQERAKALSRFLYDRGYSGAIKTEGRGEEEPFKVDDATAYSVEQLHQMHRRVDALLR